MTLLKNILHLIINLEIGIFSINRYQLGTEYLAIFRRSKLGHYYFFYTM